MTAKRRIPLRHVIAVFIGNGLEFYDFLTFAYFEVYIGHAFFPSTNPSMSLLASTATFGVGFLTRPIGAIVIGGMGDRVGRKPAMLLSFWIMGIAILGVALTPSYAQIGIAAPVLVVLWRLLQGFALGGNVGPTTAYMVEAAPAMNRGFYTAMQYATQDCAGLTASVVGLSLSLVLSKAALGDWGWRVAFLIGVAIVPFGIYLRRDLPETLRIGDADEAPAAGAAEPRARVRDHMRIIVLGLVMLGGTTIGSYTLNYMTTYALDTLRLAAGFAFGVGIVNTAFSIVWETLSGILSDKFGRKPVALGPGIVLLISILPGFWIIGHFRTAIALYAVVAWLASIASLAVTPPIIMISETLPPSIRSGAVATVYAFAIAIFGGSVHSVITALIATTHNPMAPAWYWTGAALCFLIAVALTRESAPAKTMR